MSQKYNQEQIKFVKEQVDKKGKVWQDITAEFNTKFDDFKSTNAIRKMYESYDGVNVDSEEFIQKIAENKKLKAEKNSIAKINDRIVEEHMTNKMVLDQLSKIVKEQTYKPIEIKRYIPDKTKKNICPEIMIGDWHGGADHKNFNSDILKRRVQELSHQILRDIERKEAHYNVSQILIHLLGDFIENSHFHMMESMAACEFQNPEQIRMVTELLWQYIILPIAKLGRKTTIIGLTGNHDRVAVSKTFNDPGKNGYSWIIYNFLKYLCVSHNLKNVTWIIPEGVYAYAEIFGKIVYSEHGDLIKGKTVDDFEKHIHKRSRQIGKQISYFRMGDRHDFTLFSKGRIIVNGCLNGVNSYADVLGFTGEAVQALNYYIERASGCAFYSSFPIDLEDIK